MKKLAFTILATSVATGAAMAQSETTVQSASLLSDVVQSGITPDFTFDLDRTEDASLVPLPAGAGDYEVAGSGEVVAPASYTFVLE